MSYRDTCTISDGDYVVVEPLEVIYKNSTVHTSVRRLDTVLMKPLTLPVPLSIIIANNNDTPKVGFQDHSAAPPIERPSPLTGVQVILGKVKLGPRMVKLDQRQIPTVYLCTFMQLSSFLRRDPQLTDDRKCGSGPRSGYRWRSHPVRYKYKTTSHI